MNNILGDDDVNNKTLTTAVKKFRTVMRGAEIDIEESFLMEMNSFGELSVKGCKDINGYDTENIMLVSDEYFLSVKGEGLQIKNYSPVDTVICGKIENIGFMKR